MMPRNKEKFRYSLNEIYSFSTPHPWNVTLFSKSPYLTAHLKINNEAGGTKARSEKTQGHI